MQAASCTPKNILKWNSKMDDEPNLNFDIDALFEHLVNNLGHDLEDVKDWNFSLRSPDMSVLEQVAEDLDSEFGVLLQDNVEEEDDEGNPSIGDPLLMVIRRGALTVDEVKQISERMQSIAAERGLTYDGVDCYDPIDEEALFGWLGPDDAQWRLRHMTDSGLEEDADLPWSFLVAATTLGSMHQIAAELEAMGLDDRDEYDEPDEDGNYGICIFIQGRNNEMELSEATTSITDVAEAHGGELIGMQFYTREDVAEIFSIEDET